MTVQSSGKHISYYIKCLIGIALMFVFRFLPPIGSVTEVGMQILGVFLGLIWMWSTIEVVWPSILGIIAFGMTDYCTVGDAIKNGLGNATVWQLLMVMILIAAINESGCGAAIGQWILKRKFVRGRPLLFVWTFLIGLMTVAVFTGFFAPTLLGWSILYNVMEQAGYDPKERFYTLTTYVVFVATSLGTTVLPFKGAKMSLLTAFSNVANTQIDYIGYMVFTYGTGLIILTLWVVVVMKFLFKADFSKLQNIDFEKFSQDDTKFSTPGKIYLGTFGVVILFILITTFGSADNMIVSLLNKLSTEGIFGLMIVVLSLAKYQGESLISFKKLSKKIEWNAIFICAAAIQVADAITDEASGIIGFMTGVLNPIFDGVSGYAFVVIVIVVALVLTNLANNMAVGLLLLPVVMPFAEAFDLNITLIGTMVVFSVQMAFLLPGASAPAAVLHGNEKLSLYKYGIVIMILLALTISFISYPICNILF